MRLFILTLLVVGLCGCGGTPAANSGDSGGGGNEPVAETSSADFKTYEVSKLPDMDDRPMPVKDDGRVQFALPAGWKPLKPNPKFLIACIPEDGSASKLPRITIAAGEPNVDEKSSTTESNALDLAKKLQAQLEADKKKTVEGFRPLILGDTVWIRHVRKVATADGEPAAVQSLQTIKSGRLITVELLVNAKDNPRSSTKPIIYEKELQEHRDYAYAVAANMKFPKEGGSSPPPAEKPAEEKPAPEKSE
jgi:hypothetical protein